jgi:hypothetical protein
MGGPWVWGSVWAEIGWGKEIRGRAGSNFSAKNWKSGGGFFSAKNQGDPASVVKVERASGGDI